MLIETETMTKGLKQPYVFCSVGPQVIEPDDTIFNPGYILYRRLLMSQRGYLLSDYCTLNHVDQILYGGEGC